MILNDCPETASSGSVTFIYATTSLSNTLSDSALNGAYTKPFPSSLKSIPKPSTTSTEETTAPFEARNLVDKAPREPFTVTGTFTVFEVVLTLPITKEKSFAVSAGLTKRYAEASSFASSERTTSPIFALSTLNLKLEFSGIVVASFPFLS